MEMQAVVPPVEPAEQIRGSAIIGEQKIEGNVILGPDAKPQPEAKVINLAEAREAKEANEAKEFEAAVAAVEQIAIDYEKDFQNKVAELAALNGPLQVDIQALKKYLAENSQSVKSGDVAKDLAYEKQRAAYVEQAQASLDGLLADETKLQARIDRYTKGKDALTSVGALMKIGEYDPQRKLAIVTRIMNGLNFTGVALQEKVVEGMKAGMSNQDVDRLKVQQAALTALVQKLKPIREKALSGS